MLRRHVLVTAGCIITTIFATGCDQHQNLSSSKTNDTSLCNFHHGSCLVSIEENDISLALAPSNAPSEKPLTFQLTLSKSTYDIKAKLEGRDMFMGVIPLNLTQTGEKEYQATALYGRCASDYMIWRLSLTLTDKNGVSKHTWFDFKADNAQ